MKLKELKCKNCGAKLEVPENAKKVDCKFCNSSFFIEDAYDEGYKYEKGRLNAQTDHFKESTKGITNVISKIGKTVLITYVIAFIVVIIIFGFIFYNIFSSFSDFKKDSFDNKTEINDKLNKEFNEKLDEITNTDDSNSVDKDYFNIFFSNFNGTQSGFLIKPKLDIVISSNKEYTNHQIIVEYNGISSSKEEDINKIKKQIDDQADYEATVNYDENGFINEVIIK